MLKHAILGLLAQRERHGYEIKAAFEDLLGGTWPVNVGQVYTTLAHLERDGMVESEVVPQEALPDRKVYRLTEAGWGELMEWLAAPAATAVQLKDDFFVKVLIHSLVDAGDPLALIWRQRQACFSTLAQLNRLRSDAGLNPATALLVEGAVLRVEADIRWLDLCETRIGDLKR